MSGQDAETGSNNKNRARGVKASPLKLRAALNAKGLKSQAEVAEVIRQKEGLAKPPRTLVGRVFRSEAVDPVSIERVARVLDVEAWSLYLDSSEKALFSTNTGATANANASQDLSTKNAPSVDAGEKENNSHTVVDEPPTPLTASPTPDKFTHTHLAQTQQVDHHQGKGIKGWFVLCFVALILVASFLYQTIYPVQEPLPNQSSGIDFSNKVLVVLPFEGPRGDDFGHLLHNVLNEASHWVTASSLHAGSANPLELIGQQKTDLVFSGKVEQIGRRILIKIYISESSLTRQVWADTFVKSASNEYIKRSLARWFDIFADQKGEITFPESNILTRYLNAQSYMHQDRTYDVLLRALTDFQGVVRLAPKFAKGHASLCMALIEYSKLSGDKVKLEEAELHCQMASELAPDDTNTLAANAHLLRSKGLFEEAQELVSRVLLVAPDNIDAIRSLAEIQMRIYLKQRDEQLFAKIERKLQRAATIEQDNWKIPYTLARLYYFAGQQQLAIEQFQLANDIYPSYQTHNNLGTLEFCVGNLSQARTHYQQALTYKPNETSLLSNIATLAPLLRGLRQSTGDLSAAAGIVKTRWCGNALSRLGQHGGCLSSAGTNRRSNRSIPPGSAKP